MIGIFFGPILISHSHDGDSDLSGGVSEENEREGSSRVTKEKREGGD
jgi:hypothetical protein